MALVTAKVVRPVNPVLWLAIATACFPGLPAMLLVITALSTRSLETWEHSLVPLCVPFVLAPLAAYGLWFLSRRQGGKLSFFTSLLVVGLTIFGVVAIFPAFLIGLSIAPLAQDATGFLLMGIAVLVSIATVISNVFLFVMLIINRK